MDSEAIFVVCAGQRRELADLLDGLAGADLDTPSLCAGWTVRTVAAHLAGALTGSLRTFIGVTLRHGGTCTAPTTYSPAAAPPNRCRSSLPRCANGLTTN